MALKAILALPRLGVMLMAALLLIGGAVDAAACIPETSHYTGHGDTGTEGHPHIAAPDTSGQSEAGDHHAVCAHGHCHHSAASLLDTPPQPALWPLLLPAHASAAPALTSSALAPPTQPPRA